MLTATVAALGVMLPAVAQAEPPSNDDFGTSTVISALPFTVQQDTSEATRAADDPRDCQGVDGGTVWFSFTPTVDMQLRAGTAGSDYETILSASTGDRGQLTQVPGACAVGTDGTINFRASAGTTYHFLVAGFFTPGGSLSFALNAVPIAPNDNFTNAEPISALPATRQADLSGASAEPAEPSSRCTFDRPPGRSVWYAFTSPAARSVVAQTDTFNTAVSVYTGSALADLQPVQCARDSFESAVFRADPAVTYYLSVSAPTFFAGPVTLRLTEAPPIQPFFNLSPSDPSIFDQTQFSAFANDPVGQPIAGGEWAFGDGTTAPVTSSPTTHRYAVDGTYQVRLTVTTRDGRTGTTTRPVPVVTHDVSIAKFSVPTKARTGETKPITVQVANTRYRENAVTVDLFKNSGQSWEFVGTLTLDVPARADRTVKFPFAYTFSAADAVEGKVTFRAVVSLPFSRRDARPQDNEVIALSTTVLPSLTDLRFA